MYSKLQMIAVSKQREIQSARKLLCSIRYTTPSKTPSRISCSTSHIVMSSYEINTATHLRSTCRKVLSPDSPWPLHDCHKSSTEHFKSLSKSISGAEIKARWGIHVTAASRLSLAELRRLIVPVQCQPIGVNCEPKADIWWVSLHRQIFDGFPLWPLVGSPLNKNYLP